MPIALTCDCGARFELDELLAGRKVNCPECRQPLEAPAVATTAQPRTSLFALASVVLALVGGFTVVGGVAAAVLGAIALVHIHRQRDRLAGAALAMAGLTAGLSFTALTVGILIRNDFLPIAAWVRSRTMAGQVDTTGSREVVTRDGKLILRRPAEQWGRVRGDRSDDPAVGDLQQKRELLLADVARHAFIDVGRMGDLTTATDYHARVNEDLNPPRPPLLDDEDVPFAKEGTTPPWRVGKPTDVKAIGNWKGLGWVYDVRRGGQTWRFLIRVYKKKPEADPRNAEPAYVVRGYAPRREFAAIEKELLAAMDSIDLPK